MKTTSLFLLCIALTLTFGLGCKSSKPAKPGKGDRTIPADIEAAYRQDAARLAVREMLTSNSTGEEGAAIPPARIEYFFTLLKKIHWMGVDSSNIPNLSGIHTLPTPHLRRVLVFLHPDAPMRENWSQGITTTSDLYLNQLMSRYGLKIKDYNAGAGDPMLILEADRDINTAALAEMLSHHNGIKLAEAEGIMGDGNNIEWGGEGKNQMALRLSIGAGDCPSGCIQRKLWIFYVSQEGNLTYMGTRGEIPAELEPKE